MRPRKLLADISRDFLTKKKICRYRMKKIAEMGEDELISNCHFFCEENGLTEEWAAFRKKAEAEYRYCAYLEEYIEDGLCCDLQMVTGDYVKASALPERKIDKEKCAACCSECKYRI